MAVWEEDCQGGEKRGGGTRELAGGGEWCEIFCLGV